MSFNLEFQPLDSPLTDQDIFWDAGNDSSFFEFEQLEVTQRRLTGKIRLLKSFMPQKIIWLRVPAKSRLRAVNRMKLNEFPDRTLELTSVRL